MSKAEKFVRGIYPTAFARQAPRLHPKDTLPWWDIVFPGGYWLKYLGWGHSERLAWNAAKRYIENQMITELSN